MQMNSYNYAGFLDEVPSLYQQDEASAYQEQLPFVGLDASPSVEPSGAVTEVPFHDYYGGAGAGEPEELMAAGARQGTGGMMEVDREQCRIREPGAVESSRGFRHMMRERQRREKLSQSYADLYAVVAARSKGDKNSIVQSAAMYVHELKGAREQLQRRNEELKGRILGHDARQPSVKVDFEVDDPASGVDSMIGALRRLKSMGVKARGIRSTMSGGRLWTEMNVETTIEASEVEKAVEEALTMNQAAERNRPAGAA